MTADAWDDLLNDNRLSLSYKKRAAAFAEHRPLIEAAIRSGSQSIVKEPQTLASGSPTDAALRAAWTIDSALQASLDTEAVATGPWAGKRWVPAGAFIDLDLPCPMRSSITDQPCALRWGHPADSGTRFHRFAPPGAASGSPEPVLDVDLRAAVESAIRLAEVIPLSVDVEQAGMQAGVAILTLRAALAALPSDTEEAIR